MNDIVQRLRMERRATAWRRGLDCDFPTAFEQHPLCQEAAAEITRLRAEAEALRKALLAIVDRDFTFFDGYVDRYTITYGEIQQARAAIAATKEQQA